MENKNLKGVEKIRAFIDLEATGDAKGGYFIKSLLKDTIDEVEADGKLRVVGVVYDETYDLEIITKPIKQIEEEKKINEEMQKKINGKK